MSDLFEQVFHHILGTETEIQNWHTLDGIKTVEFHSFGPDRWIESVHERGRMTGIECLAMILFEVDESFFDPEPARQVVEAWAVELRKAVSAGEIQARDPVTLLALETLPDGWEWLLSMADADKFIASRGMEWRFGEVALHLFNQSEQAIENRRFPPWEREAKQPAPAQNTATPAPVGAVEIDFTMVATRKELIEAFGRFTDMNMTWFDNLNDAPRLKDARKYAGQGGRHSAEPLFCPFEVMQWLADPKRKKGKTLSDTTAWRLLKSHFPKVHNQYSIGDPNAD